MSEENNVPISTKWLVDSMGEDKREIIKDIFLIICPKNNNKGTGFLYKSGHIITNWHVVKNCSQDEIVVISSNGKEINLSKII